MSAEIVALDSYIAPVQNSLSSLDPASEIGVSNFASSVKVGDSNLSPTVLFTTPIIAEG